MLFVLLLVPVAGLLLTGHYRARGRLLAAWVASAVLIGGTTLFGVVGIFPALLPSSLNPAWSLTIANSSSSPLTLAIMTERLDSPLRREQIAEAALAIVVEQGLGAVTVRRVAEAVGISAAALYRHYKNKADILRAVLEEHNEIHMGFFVVLCLGLAFLMRTVPGGLVPSEDQGYLLAVTILPDGTALGPTIAMRLRKTPATRGRSASTPVSFSTMEASVTRCSSWLPSGLAVGQTASTRFQNSRSMERPKNSRHSVREYLGMG